MGRHLHSTSKNAECISLSSPESPVAWGLPTPPPSLSELSTLARAGYPSTRLAQFGEDRCGPIGIPQSIQHISRDQYVSSEDCGGLLPMSYDSSSHSNYTESHAWVWPVPWFNCVASLRRTAARSFGLLSGSGIILSRLGGIRTSVATWLALYLVCNLSLTLHSKHLLNSFPYPWLLTALHALCAAIGSWICAWRGVFEPAPLNHPTTPLLALFSVLYSANIAASNASLRFVSIATHQVIRAATPLFVILFAWIGRVGLNTPGSGSYRTGKLEPAKQRVGYLGVTSAKLKSLTPVVLGVVFATYGDYSYTRTGLMLTLLGTALAALKTMLASRVVRPRTDISLNVEPGRLSNATTKTYARIARGHSRSASSKRAVDEGYLSGDEHIRPDLPSFALAPPLHPLDVLLRLSPFACIQCLVAAFLSGETARWSTSWAQSTPIRWQALALNGILAFLLNYVSFVANLQAGALSMTVVANVKQALTILLALLVFNTGTPSITHLLGIGLTLGGGVWYGYLEVKEKGKLESKEGQKASV